MAVRKNTILNRHKFKINGLALLFPVYFFYQQLQIPVSQDPWVAKQVGEFNLTIQPVNKEAPYAHDADWFKDFTVFINKGSITQIRQAYANIGTVPVPIEELQLNDIGLLHGSNLLQHVHAISPVHIASNDKMWITIQTWDGTIFTQSWQMNNLLKVD
ncbi:MAG: hypothetical protein ACI9LX_001228 [Paraglaciecola sp.]|jgi:hypothetical protein